VKGQKVAVTRKVVRGVRFFCHLTVPRKRPVGISKKAESAKINLNLM